MKRKKMVIPALVFCLFLFGLLAVSVSSIAGAEQQEKKGEIAVIERDTIQTRNFIPVINHEAMVVNLTDHPLDIGIQSPLPEGKYRKDAALSAFGKASKLGAPAFSPFTVPIDDFILLEKPQVNIEGKDVSYLWKKVELPGRYAAVAQYDNYYGPLETFFKDWGMDIAGLLIGSQYTVEKKEDIYKLSLVITLQNEGKHPVKALLFRIFVPHALSLADRDEPLNLVNPVEMYGSENLTVTSSSIVDGFGNTARGVDASLQLDSLEAGTSVQLALQMDCIKEVEVGEIYPVLYIIGRRKLARLWPPTIISGAHAESNRTFHYLLYNLVIGDRRIFRLHKGGIDVVPAESVKTPTHGTRPRLPEK